MKILKKDIIIPAGTKFECVDGMTSQFVEGNYEFDVALGNDMTGRFIVGVEDSDEDWFEEKLEKLD